MSKENNEVSQQLIKVAESLDKIAESLEKENEVQSQQAKKDFGFGKLGSNTSSNQNPLLDFILS